MQKISCEKLDILYAVLAGLQPLYLPVEKAGEVDFYPYAEGEKVRLDVLHTLRSAKDLFFPQSENLMKFKREGGKLTVEQPVRLDEDFVIFGVRACDARSFTVMDKVFLSEPVDSYYANRREHGIIVSMACGRPEETCFCQTFAINAAEPEGDVVTWLTEEGLFWEAKTEKGKALTEKISSLFEEADEAPVQAQKEKTAQIMEKLPLKDLDLSYFKEHDELTIFNDKLWSELSSHCLGCGTCTFVCPTCQCYDIRDYDTGNGVVRYRCWDSCMYRDFTKMASGNPRKTQIERFRQRFMHKLVYFPANNDGMCMCVGCGRCLAKCPISMNIAKVIRAIGGEER